MDADKKSLSIATPNGMAIEVRSRGATLASVRLPVGGAMSELVLRYADTAGYRNDKYYIGATVGRYANRIANAKFGIGDAVFDLDANETATGNCLHGGTDGLSRRDWLLEESADGAAIVCRCQSADGDQGFPGKVDVTVTYRITSAMSLQIEFYAETDRETVLSLANHTYWNLGGAGSAIDDHELLIHADEFTPTNETRIPTGELASVSGTENDFRASTRIVGVAQRNVPFDINYAIRGARGELRAAAELYSPESGLRMRMATTQAGMQLYTGDYLDEPFIPRQGVCLEAQGFPNAPNEPRFPSTTLRLGLPYSERTVFEFDAET